MEALCSSSPFLSFRLTTAPTKRPQLEKPMSNYLTLLIITQLPHPSLSSTHKSKVDFGRFTAFSSSSYPSNHELFSNPIEDEEAGIESQGEKIGNLRQQPRVPPLEVIYSLFPEKKQTSRRLVSISLVLLQWLYISTTQSAIAGSILDKYVKRKKLDPLESYVPAVLLTKFQIKDLGKTLEVDQPQFASFRSLLRSGPAASLRVNIRAVAQYAADNGNGEGASKDVDRCLGALEDLDSLFLRASRNDSKASVESMKAKISVALNALDSLLGTVPSDVLDKGKAIADAYLVSEDIVPENLDPKMKELESIL